MCKVSSSFFYSRLWIIAWKPVVLASWNNFTFLYLVLLILMYTNVINIGRCHCTNLGIPYIYSNKYNNTYTNIFDILNFVSSISKFSDLLDERHSSMVFYVSCVFFYSGLFFKDTYIADSLGKQPSRAQSRFFPSPGQ